MWAPSLAVLIALAGAPQDPAPDPEVVAAAVADLAAAFRGGVKEEKVRALERASDVAAPAVVDEVTRGFKDREHEVRAATIQALRWMADPAALEALRENARQNRTIKKDEELYPAILKAVGQHGDPSSVPLLSHKPFDSPFYQAGRARILGLGRIPFSEAPLSWQLSDIFYGAIDTIAAVGLFQQKSWGVAAFFVAAISEVLLFTLVPQWFVVEPAQLTMLRGFVAYHLVAISIYFVLRHLKIE